MALDADRKNGPAARCFAADAHDLIPGKVSMPFIREYSEGELPKEDRLVIPARKSPIETALHETLHAVILRLNGLDIADVVENDDVYGLDW